MIVYDNKKVIPQELIDECESRSIKEDKTYFIFDEAVRKNILKRSLSLDAAREITIDEIIEDDVGLYVGDITEFEALPSIMSYYDTETKMVDRYSRYKFVTDYITKLGFTPGLSNIGLEYEQGFTLFFEGHPYEIHEFTLRIKPNMFYTISFSKMYKAGMIGTTSSAKFFNKREINKFISDNAPDEYKSQLRDVLLEEILYK